MSEQVPYLLMCAAALWLSAYAPARHRLHCLGAAFWLTCDNMIYNMAWDGRAIVTAEWWPVMTLAFFGLIFWMLFERFAWWKVATLMVTGCQGLAHVVFWGVGDWSHGSWHTYAIVLNVTFVCQLLCVTWEGLRGAWISNRAWCVPGAGRGGRTCPFNALACGFGRLGRLARSPFKART